MSDRISAEDARRMLEAATPGPWSVVGLPWNPGAPWVCASEDPHFGRMVADTSPADDFDSGPDAALIAAAPTLAATAIALESENERLRRMLACERGDASAAPEGWRFDGDWVRKGDLVTRVIDHSGSSVTVSWFYRDWSVQGSDAKHSRAETALEAMEAADAARGQG